MNPTLKRYAISSAITFVTAFLVSIGAQLTLVHVTPETLGWGIVASVAATACRAAIKAVIEGISGLNGDLQG